MAGFTCSSPWTRRSSIMTTQPEARLFRLSPEESVLGAARRPPPQGAPAGKAAPRAPAPASDVRIEVRRRAAPADGAARPALADASAAAQLLSDDEDDDGLPD